MLDVSAVSENGRGIKERREPSCLRRSRYSCRRVSIEAKTDDSLRLKAVASVEFDMDGSKSNSMKFQAVSDGAIEAAS